MYYSIVVDNYIQTGKQIQQIILTVLGQNVLLLV